MTMTEPLPERPPARPHRRRWVTWLAVLVVIALGALLTTTVVLRDDDASDASAAAQLSRARASCGDRMMSPQGVSTSDDRWCTDLFAWMDRSGGATGGAMMWQAPARLEKGCREWVGQDRDGTDRAGRQRCRDMVEWMDTRMSGRGPRWMMPGR